MEAHRMAWAAPRSAAGSDNGISVNKRAISADFCTVPAEKMFSQ
jgi:hypothetical protein